MEQWLLKKADKDSIRSPGQICSQEGCSGTLEEEPEDECVCGVDEGPCVSCVNSHSVCNECGFDYGRISDMHANIKSSSAVKEARETFSGLDEGDRCPEEGCDGTLYYKREDPCSCHINPPCSACQYAPLTCDKCRHKIYSED